jgi:hypothetical protein
MLRRIALVLVVSATTLVLPAVEAHADTHVTGNITTNTTWTLAGSPYFIDRTALTVSSGVTLTIQPDVVVVFTKGLYNTILVQGTLNAIGSFGHNIVFTSLQDYNGSGGLPGQWQAIKFQGTSTSTLDYADIRYGGYTGYAYQSGAVMVQNNANLSIDHSMIRWSNTSGVQATSTNPVYIAHTLLAYNIHGVSVIGGTYGAVRISDSSIAHNSGHGVFMNWGGPPSAQSSITNSNVTDNGANGVQLQVAGSVPVSLYPTGTHNNIWANGQKQVGVLYARHNAYGLWDDNYWGDTQSGPLLCPWAPTLWQFHVFYYDAFGYPQPGPISSDTYTEPGTKLKCAADRIPVLTFTSWNDNQAPPY